MDYENPPLKKNGFNRRETVPYNAKRETSSHMPLDRCGGKPILKVHARRAHSGASQISVSRGWSTWAHFSRNETRRTNRLLVWISKVLGAAIFIFPSERGERG